MKQSLEHTNKGSTGNPFHDSMTDEYYTPESVAGPLVKVFPDGLDLDPGSSEVGNRRIKAKVIFDRLDDGLAKQWSARTVFNNPPGGTRAMPGSNVQQSNARLWWEKACAEYERAERRMSIVFLAFSLELFQRGQTNAVAPYEFPFLVPRMRLKFDVEARTRIAQLRERLEKTGDEKKRDKIEAEVSKLHQLPGDHLVPGNQPTHSNAIILLPDVGDRAVVKRFAAAYQHLGKVRR